MKTKWDIFCSVVDNYGDIGVCWRLARQLVSQYNLKVRLWVDDMKTFSHIEPRIIINCNLQWLYGVEIRCWSEPFEVNDPGEVIIEAFACNLPESYIAAMAELPLQPVWINLEYLSAENWVTSYHCLPSLHPYLPLINYFFFPGFVPGTGGLLREGNRCTSANEESDNTVESRLLEKLHVPECAAGQLRISLFCYESAPLNELLAIWSESTTPIYLLVPHGTVSEAVAKYFDCFHSEIGTKLHKRQLTVQLIPFLAQSEYDILLRCCDFNFVRGEDSFVSSQWTARPFIWHIYPQEDNAHQVKLAAFLDLYTAKMMPDMAAVIRKFWLSWNDIGHIGESWSNYLALHMALKQHGDKWLEQLLTHTDLASNLIQFAKNKI